MAVAGVNITINGVERRYEAIPNPSLKNRDGTKKSALDHLISFNGSPGGPFRVLQLFERLSKVAVLILKEMGSKMSVYFEGLAGKFGLASAMTGFARLPDVMKKAWNAVTQLINPPAEAPVSANRDKIEKLHDIADATAALGYAGSLLAGSSALKEATALKYMADVSNLVADFTDLQTSSQDFSLAKKSVEVIAPLIINVDALRARNAPAAEINAAITQNKNTACVNDIFVYKQRHSFIAVIKAISSVAGGVLGLMVLALGGPILPAAALLAISLTSTIAAIAKDFYEKTALYKMPDFFQPIRNPQMLGVDSRAVAG